MNDNYEPCFATAPRTWKGRWKLIREFTRRWHGVDVGPVGELPARVAREERKLKLELPPSFREWISFSNELIAKTAFSDLLRDCYEVKRLKENSAVSLMIQGESDVYWGVKVSNLKQADPPVEDYFLDYGADTPTFHHHSTFSRRITSFVLKHMAHFCGRNGGFMASGTQTLVSKLRVAFPVASEFEELIVVENTNVFGLLYPDHRDQAQWHFVISAYKPPFRKWIPKQVRALAPAGVFAKA